MTADATWSGAVVSGPNIRGDYSIEWDWYRSKPLAVASGMSWPGFVSERRGLGLGGFAGDVVVVDHVIGPAGVHIPAHGGVSGYKIRRSATGPVR